VDILSRITILWGVVFIVKNAARIWLYYLDYDNALGYYNNVTDPALQDEAMLGSAYVLYWQGEYDQARNMLAAVSGKAASGDDAQQLHDLLAQNTTVAENTSMSDTSDNTDNSDQSDQGGYYQKPKAHTSLSGGHREATDSEHNSYKGNTAVLNIPLDHDGSAIFISHEAFDLDNTPAGQSASGTNTRVGVTARLDDHTRITGYAGKVSIDNTGAQTIDHTDVGVALTGQFNNDWGYHASYNDNLLYDTPKLANNGVSLKNTEVGTSFKLFDDHTSLGLNYETGDLSDGNTRTGYSFDLRRSNCSDRGELAWGLRGRQVSFDSNLDHGYFDPDKYQLGELYLDWVDHSAHDLKWDAGASVGMQKIDNNDWRTVTRIALGLRWDMSEHFRIRAGVTRSDLPTNAEQTSDDYNSQSWYVNGEWQF